MKETAFHRGSPTLGISGAEAAKRRPLDAWLGGVYFRALTQFISVGFVYHDNWLHNLLISASMGGYQQ